MDRDKMITALNEIGRIVAGALHDCNALPAHANAMRRPSAQKSKNPTLEISFNTNVLAFMKKHGVGLSGGKKFVVLLAYLTKGETSRKVSLADMKHHWNRMKSVTGGKFNPAYANRAKASGWIDAPTYGTYTLASDWRRVFGQ